LPETEERFRIARIVVALSAAFGFWLLASHIGTFDKPFWQPQLFCLLAVVAMLTGWGPRGVARAQATVAGLLLTLVIVFAIPVQSTGGQDRVCRVMEWGTDAQVAEWGVFHYYLGSKYFDELGYTGLYTDAYLADWDGGKGPQAFGNIKKVRDLRNYRREKVSTLQARGRSAGWTDERWADFKKDVAWFGPQADHKRWSGILSDRGYNPPPSYTLIAGLWSNLLSILTPAQQTLLICLDVLLLLAAFLFSVRAYGYRRSALVLCCFLLWYGNSNRAYGQIWLLDWFAACWSAMSAWKLKRHGLSGGLIGYAASVRIFPGVLFVGPLVVWAIARLRGRPVDSKRLVRFLVAGAAVMLFLVTASTVRYGAQSWQGFAANISEHNQSHKAGKRRFGLEHIFVLDFHDGLKANPRKLGRAAAKNQVQNKSLYRGAALLLVLLTLGAMARSREHDAILLGVCLFFALTVASRYYGAILALLLLLGCGSSSSRAGPGQSDTAESSHRSTRALMFDAALLLLIFVVYAARFSSPQIQYVFSNLGWFFWWVALLGTAILRPPMQRPAPEGS